MMKFWAAWQFLTIFPGPRPRAEELSRSSGYFPLVGLILGLILAGLDWGLGEVLPAQIVNVLLVGALLLLTRGIHLDGFLDTCDGLGSPGPPRERLRVMSDSRVGAFGVIGGCVLILLKYASLFLLIGNLRLPGLILMPVVSRWAIIWAIFVFPTAKREGMGWAFKQGTGARELALATLFALAGSLALVGLRGVIMLGLALLATSALAWLLCRSFGGQTGDTYGALNELMEVFFLLTFPFVGGLKLALGPSIF